MWLRVPSAFCPCVPVSPDLTPESGWRLKMLVRSATWRTTPMPAARWMRLWKRKPWMTRLFGRICEPSMAARGAERWIASWADFHVNRSPWLANAEESRTPGTSGPTSPGSSTSADPSGRSSKTSPAYSASLLPMDGLPTSTSRTTYLEWVSALRRESTARRKSAHRISGSACSSWPTPKVIQGGPESARRKQELGRTASGGGDLQSTAVNWPTPMARDGAKRSGGKRKKDDLSSRVEAWPSPTAHDGRRPGLDAKSTQGANLSKSVSQFSLQDLGTGTDGLGSSPPGQTSPPPSAGKPKLNPLFVEWLMGFPEGWSDAGNPTDPTAYAHWETRSCRLALAWLSCHLPIELVAKTLPKIS